MRSDMNSKLIVLASAATIAVTAVALPNQAEARWRGGGWWVPGAVVGGLALGAAIASRPYYYGDAKRIRRRTQSMSLLGVKQTRLFVPQVCLRPKVDCNGNNHPISC